MDNLSNTQYFSGKNDAGLSAHETLNAVYRALEEKGYNPVNQIVGYIMSGDPSYITSYKGARSLIIRIERDELVEALLRDYISHNYHGQK